MKSHVKLVCSLFFVLVLQACASHQRVDPDNTANRSLPKEVSAANIGQTYVWGGKVISSEVKEDHTILTVLSFPLKSSEVPKTKDLSGGRFKAVYEGFLEPADYPKNTKLTIVGKLTAFEDGFVSQASYQFPVISIEDIALHKSNQQRYRLPISLGIGFGF